MNRIALLLALALTGCSPRNVIASEVDVEMFIEDAEDDARDLARTGKRLAILALYAAWFAQQHADKLHATKTAEKGARLVEGENT